MRLGLADEVLAKAAELRNRGESCAVATVVRIDPPTSASPGDKAVITADGTLFGWIGGSCSESLIRREALLALADGQPRLVQISPDAASPPPPPAGEGRGGGIVAHLSTCPSAGALDVFIDPQLPRPQLLVVGATPAAHTLLRIGAAIGFRACAVHPGAAPSDFPEADAVVASLDLASRVGVDTWAVVATMGHYDEDALAALLPLELPYIAVIASRRRMEAILQLLEQRALGGLDRIRRAGGDAVGRSQQEIALATVADIVAQRHAQDPVAVPLAPTAVDPICGMSVEIDGGLSTEVAGTTYYFCSAHCRQTFLLQWQTTPTRS